MVNLFIRTYTFTDGTTAYGSQVEAEVANIVNTLNSLNTAVTNWGQVSALHATNVPLIADVSSGSQDIADFKNNAVIKASIGSGGQLTLKPTTNQIVLGTTNTVTISSTAPASSRTYTMPDVGGAGTFAFLEKAQTFTVVQTLSAAAGNPVHGTNTNDSAAAGYTGEYIESVVSAVNFPTSNTWGDAASISLTAGDWDVTFTYNIRFQATTISELNMGISQTTGNASTGLVEGSNFNGSALPIPTAAGEHCGAVVCYRQSLSGTTTIYAKFRGTFSSTAPTLYGRLSARRMR